MEKYGRARQSTDDYVRREYEALAEWVHSFAEERPILGAFAKLRKATVSFIMSVRPYGTRRFPLDGFSMKSNILAFPKICQKHSTFIKITLHEDGFTL
jgi:hypothetical protein